MEPHELDAKAGPLRALLGEWRLEVEFPNVPAPPDVDARTTFEWMSCERFLVQRWEVPLPEAPDGLAVIGFDEGSDTYLQHYFDSRGVARVYEMTLEGPRWTLTRTKPDFAPLGFHQRFDATFSDDGGRIDGRWERTGDDGEWLLDFDLSYVRLR